MRAFGGGSPHHNEFTHRPGLVFAGWPDLGPANWLVGVRGLDLGGRRARGSSATPRDVLRIKAAAPEAFFLLAVWGGEKLKKKKKMRGEGFGGGRVPNAIVCAPQCF